jgi:ABC-type transport system involved in multi-copper enzyme maturation permease subunit
MGKIIVIALNTFKEAVRNKVLYFLLIFAVLLIGFSTIISDLSIAEPERMIKDLGLASIDFFGFLIAVFVGVYLVYNELDRKTIYTIVSKPIDRTQFLLGKFFGLLFTIYVNIAIMTFVLFAVLYFRETTDFEVMSKALYSENAAGEYVQTQTAWMYYLKAVGMSMVKSVGTMIGVYVVPLTAGLMKVVLLSALGLAVITSFAIFYSTFSTPTLSAVFTFLTFVIGGLCEDIMRFAERLAENAGGVANLVGADAIKYWFGRIAVLIVPNLAYFDRRMEAVYGAPDITAAMTGPPLLDWQTIVYGITYTAAILCLACLIFRRRSFK